MPRSSRREAISTKQVAIAELARKAPQMVLTTLAHHIDAQWLQEAYRRTRKSAAAGVDGVTAEQYEAKLTENLESLLDRLHTGRYRAPAVRRVHVPKPGGKTRPIGIPTLEDKVLQRAVLMALEPVYEQDFLECSYGFRPGRGAHQALEALWQRLRNYGGGWVIDLDIQSFFDQVGRDHLVARLMRFPDYSQTCQKAEDRFAWVGFRATTGGTQPLRIPRTHSDKISPEGADGAPRIAAGIGGHGPQGVPRRGSNPGSVGCSTPPGVLERGNTPRGASHNATW